jgi:2-polyprenyl-3-methyl-5-hydroxy-6-metoxy-1,4-benzoquinol methylase
MRRGLKEDLVKTFEEMREEFPFPDYVDRKLGKYLAVAARIMERYPPGSRILSIGCGPCDLESVLAKLGYSVTGIDDLKDQWHLLGRNRERIVEFAKQQNIDLIVNSAESSSKLEEDSFDVSLLIDVIEHIHGSPRQILNFMISCTKPGGLVLTETPNSVALAKRLKVLVGRTNYVNLNFIFWTIGDYRSHIREYTRLELSRVLEYEGLEDIDSRMRNSLVKEIRAQSAAERILVRTYDILSNTYPNFRDTISVSGRKPVNWRPLTNSMEMFRRAYPQMSNDTDKEPDEIAVQKIISGN